ncbi:MAG TPA: hypothetical protein ENF18_04815 [candidate division WOR-3 bacterium]|uniref:DUF5362 domain-containing protein n=1 Tax=candidate division WOR-3 bacterium TaxID=2052148 RepID=A0A7C0ZD13_UNCW3|nr:hypothetical protein [candidate division WOR-3 bacterium]
MEMNNQAVLDDSVKVVSSEMSGWLKLVGIVSIVMGGLAALTIIGIITAWLPIWQGVLLLRAGNDFANVSGKEQEAVLSGLKNLKIYFIIQGIIVLIGIASSVLAIFLVGVSGIMDAFRGLY